MRRHKNARYRGLAVLLALLIVAYLGTRHLSGSLDPQYAENESDFAAANQPFSQSRYLAQHYGREWTYGEPAPAGIPPQSGPPPGVWYPPAKSGEPDAPTGMVPPQKAANQERSTPVGTAERIDNQTAGSTTRPAPPAGKTTTVAQSPTGGPKATDSNRAAKRRARRASTAERRPYIVRYEPITPITPIIPDYPSSDLMRRLYLPEYPRLDAMPGLQVPSYPRPDGVPQPQPPQRTGPDVLPGTQPPDYARPGVLPQPQAPNSTRRDVVPQPQTPDRPRSGGLPRPQVPKYEPLRFPAVPLPQPPSRPRTDVVPRPEPPRYPRTGLVPRPDLPKPARPGLLAKLFPRYPRLPSQQQPQIASPRPAVPPPPPITTPRFEQRYASRQWPWGPRQVPAPQPPRIVPATYPGGVDLATDVGALDVLGKLRGAVIDRKTRRVVLLANEKVAAPPASPDEWRVALRAAREESPPRFSLDPVDPRKPDGPWQKCVYYGPIEHTSVGLAMFEADVLIKKLALGTAQAGVPGFKNLFELTFARPNFSSSSSYSRFWIVCAAPNIQRSEDALVFGRPKMRVCTERMYVSSSGLESSGGKEDPSAAALARWLTDHYDELARHHKCLADLQRIANLMALAQWMVSQGVDASLEGFLPPQSQPVQTPKTFQTLTRKQSRTSRSVTNTSRGKLVRTVTKRVTLIGGVDLTVRLPAVSKAPEAQNLAAAAQSWAARLPARQAAFRAQYGNGQLIGIVIPAT